MHFIIKYELLYCQDKRVGSILKNKHVESNMQMSRYPPSQKLVSSLWHGHMSEKRANTQTAYERKHETGWKQAEIRCVWQTSRRCVHDVQVVSRLQPSKVGRTVSIRPQWTLMKYDRRVSGVWLINGTCRLQLGNYSIKYVAPANKKCTSPNTRKRRQW